MRISLSEPNHAARANGAVMVALGLANEEHLFVASLAQMVLQSEDLAEMRSLLSQMYAIALEDGCLYLAELSDEALQHLELADMELTERSRPS